MLELMSASILLLCCSWLNYINTMDKSKRRWCYVPMCKNTACSTPYKKFLTVPYNKGERQTWYDVAHREGPMSSGRLWCCEDHFGNVRAALISYLNTYSICMNIYNNYRGTVHLVRGVLTVIFATGG